MPVINQIFLELNEDFSIKDQTQDPITPYSNGTVKIQVLAKTSGTDALLVGYLLENGNFVPEELLQLVQLDVDSEGTNEWSGFISPNALGAAAQDGARDFKARIVLSDLQNPVINQEAGFVTKEGVVNVPGDLTGLTPTLNESYAVVLYEIDGTTPNGNIWQYRDTDLNGDPIPATWIDSGLKEVLVYKNSVVAEYQIEEGWVPSEAPIEPSATQNILDYLATLAGRLGSLETLLGNDGENFVKSDLLNEYSPTSTPEGDDQLYIEKANGDKRRVAFSDLAAGARDNFVGTFATASGLSCPDPNDLLCTYPNGIADPNDRLGWVANVTATNSLWRWIIASNEWQDSGEAPSLAKDIGYDPLTDPSTNETNVQDAMNEHGNKIDQNKTRSETNENKTQNLDTSGDIAAGKDLGSSDLDTGTGGTYQAVIQALIAEFGRNNSQDVLISNNASDIAARLVEDFSSLLNKNVPAVGDLLVLWDGTQNRNISFAELTDAIETQIQFYQGYYVDLAALESAIPVGQPGWYATLGDEDTQAVWDVEGAEWVRVASKLYFTKTAGDALTVRVGDNETAISSIQATLITKENSSNKLNTRVGNEGSTQFFLTIAGIEEYVEPIRIRGNESNTHLPFVQQVGTTKFQANFNDTELREGRIIRGRIDTITVQPGVVQISIDGGITFKNLTAVQIVDGDPTYVDFDLSVNNVFGRYIKVIFFATIDKWVIYDTNENLARIVGVGWSLDVTLMGEKLRNDIQDQRLSIIEGGSLGGKSFSLAQISLTNPITGIDDGDGWVKVPFGTVTINPNDVNVVDVASVDTANDGLIVQVDEEPGYEFQGNIVVAETGSADLELQAGLFNAADPIIEANLLDQFTVFVDNGNDPQDRSKTIKVSNEILAGLTGGFPVTLVVYVRVLSSGGSEASVTDFNFTANSLFISLGSATTDNITLKVPAEESRSGLLATQEERNKESVKAEKHLLGVNAVTIANYQSNGQFMANTDIDLSIITNPTVRVLFNGNGTDLSELIELSIDNGSNYYDVEYRLTDVDLTVKNATTHVMDLYFTGTKFVATYVDSPIENVNIPYAGELVDWRNPKNGIPAVVAEETIEKVKGVEGATNVQIVPNGNFITDTLWTKESGITIVDGEMVFTSAPNGNRAFQNILTIGQEVCIIFDITEYTAGAVRLDAGTATGTDRTAVGRYGEILTVAGSVSINARAIGTTTAKIDNVMVIPTNGRTLDEILNTVDLYFEGQRNAGEAIALEQKLDNSNDFGAWTLGATTTVDKTTEKNGVPYLHMVNGSDNSSVPITVEANTEYLFVQHNIESTLDTNDLVIGVASDIVDSNVILGKTKGLHITEFETNATTSGNIVFLITGTGEDVKFRGIIVKATYLPLINHLRQVIKNDDEIFDWIKNWDKAQTYYTQGLYWKTVGDNKAPLDFELGSVTESTSAGSEYSDLHLVSTTRLRSRKLFSVKPNEDFTISVQGDYQVGYVGFDRNLKYLGQANSFFWANPNTVINPTDETYYVALIVKRDDNGTITQDEINIALPMLKTGNDTDFTYKPYEDLYAKLDANRFGLGSVPSGARDTDTEHQTQAYELQASDITELTTSGTNTDYVRIPKEKLSGFVGLPSTQSMLIDGYKDNLATPLDDLTSINGFSTQASGTFVAIVVAKGTYANLAEAQADLAGTRIQYELATYLNRNEENNNEVTITGNLLVAPKGTAQVFGNGVLPNQFKATTAINTKAQAQANVDAIRDLSSKNKELTQEVEKLNREVTEIKEKITETILYTNETGISIPTSDLVGDAVYQDVGQDVANFDKLRFKVVDINDAIFFIEFNSLGIASEDRVDYSKGDTSTNILHSYFRVDLDTLNEIGFYESRQDRTLRSTGVISTLNNPNIVIKEIVGINL